MHLQDTMDGRIFYLGEDAEGRPGYVAAATHNTITADQFIEHILQVYRERKPLTEGFVRLLDDILASGGRVACMELARVPQSRLDEAQSFYVRALSAEGHRLVNPYAEFFRMPARSDQREDPNPGYGHIVAAWEPDRRRCRKIGWTKKAPRKWLHDAIEFAARDVYRGRTSPNRTWLAAFARRDKRVKGYPIVSHLDTVLLGDNDGQAKNAALLWRRRFGLGEED